MQGRKDYQEKLFVSFQLSDRVPVGNMYRRLREELDLSWVYRATSKYYGSEGQKSIDPVVFFKLLLIGYLENLNSDRKIIEHSSMRLDILYFLGYDVDEELPWHSTLSRTRQLYGQEVFKELFLKVLGLCVSKGMLSGRRQAIDSAYVKANASLDSLVEKAVLEDGERYLKEVEVGSQEEDKNSGGGSSLMGDGRGKEYVSKRRKESVEREQRNYAKKYAGMPKVNRKVREDESRPRFLSNHTHYSATDGDARISVKPGKARQLNYSMQTSVDIGSHVITQVGAYLADKRDSECLREVLGATISNLKEHGLQVKEMVADGSYSSGDALQTCKDNNVTAYIPNPGLYKYEREGFVYNKATNRYSCRGGKELTYRRSFVDAKGYNKDEYRSYVADCRSCPLKGDCLPGKIKYKVIIQTSDKELYDAMHERLQTMYAKVIKKRRQSTVEPVLGTLINFMGVKRVWTRGLQQANKFFLGAAIAYNLKKWLNYKGDRRTTAILSVKRALKGLFLTPFIIPALSAVYRM